jgi:hypothetical protein
VSSCLGTRGGLVAEQRSTLRPHNPTLATQIRQKGSDTDDNETGRSCAARDTFSYRSHACGCGKTLWVLRASPIHRNSTACELDCGPWMMDASCRPFSRYSNCAHSLARQTPQWTTRLVLRVWKDSLTVAWSLIQYQDSDTRILGHAATNSSTRIRLPHAR